MVADVQAALLLLRNDAATSYVPAAVWPAHSQDLSYLTAVAQQAIEDGNTVVRAANDTQSAGMSSTNTHLAYPVRTDTELHGVVVLDLLPRAQTGFLLAQRQLLWGAGWLEAFLRKRKAGYDAQAVARAAACLDLVHAAQEQRRVRQASMVAVNELATRCNAGRVSLGLERRGRLALLAISRTAWFDRKSQLVETIENAMEEAMDQEACIGLPVVAGSRGKVTVAQRDLAARAGAAAVLSVPLVAEGRPIGAITLERGEGPEFDVETVRLCEAVGTLLGPALNAKLAGERLFAGRVVDGIIQLRDRLFGPRRPLLKLSALGIVVAALLMVFAEGEFRVTAKTVVEGSVQRALVAPFEGYIREAGVRAGERVRQGTVLAMLDDRDLKLERVRWESEKAQAAGKYAEAMAKHERASARILAAQLSQAEAQLALTEEKLARTRLVAPFDAVVVSGDLSQLLGSPVEQGKLLFELAPLDAYRVVLKVDERDIAYVEAGQRGELALTGLTGHTLSFMVKTVTSVSTPQDGRNFFRVEAQLDNAAAPLRPNMEGVGKISAGKRRVVWIWTHSLVDWLRISLWSWLP